MLELPFPEIIAKKRDGKELSKEEIQAFVDGVTRHSLQDSQIGAMLMAVLMKGMTLEETGHLTYAMMNSGETLSWPQQWRGQIVDKHSTGGVGDKISLPLAPALAACGLKVPMIAGRGLGFTGGTLDKLEAIPGYNVYQSAESMSRLLAEVGCCIVGQTDCLVPADKKLYATRDVTGTVPSIPLITASIISKKGAEGLEALVLDVKTGRGAMCTKEEDSRSLAEMMVYVGNSIGMKVTAILTDMNRPIGKMVGNALEIVETIDCLHGGGPEGTRELTMVEGGHLLYNVGQASSPEAGAQMIGEVLDNGQAMTKFCQLLKAQGVEQTTADRLCAKDGDPFSVLQRARYTTDIPAPSDGYVVDINALTVGMVSYSLGAGRTKADGPVDWTVGLQLHVQRSDFIKEGSPWITVHHDTSPLALEHVDRLQAALTLAPHLPEGLSKSLVLDVIN